jgi:hypothetical protein
LFETAALGEINPHRDITRFLAVSYAAGIMLRQFSVGISTHMVRRMHAGIGGNAMDRPPR